MRNTCLFPLLILLLVSMSCTTSEPTATQPKRPNIVLIMTDDQGKGDLGFYGNPEIKTPTLDSLASVSTRLTNFYVSPVCAPTRSSLMTGRYSLRTGVWDTYNGGAILANSEITLAETLKENGYATGIFGKWHLGDTYPHRPSEQGFDESLIHPSGGMGQVGDVDNYFKFDSSYFDPVVYHNNKAIETKGYVSDVFSEGAIEFVKDNTENPFFLYLSYNAPHTPLQLPQKYLEMYHYLDIDSAHFENGPRPFPKMNEGAVRSAKRVYGMVSNIDDNLASLFHTLKELGLRENTIIIFMTDNGPQQPRYVNGMRGRKGSVYEGGINVPFFISYPGVLKENVDIDQVGTHMDMYPTLLSMAGIQVPTHEIDGIDLSPVLRGETKNLPERPLIFHWQRGYDDPYNNIAVRKGAYKLVGHVSSDAQIEDFELFNLESDKGEMDNLVATNKEKAEELKSEFDSWYNDIIRSDNLVNGPRIYIGSEEENPVILNRNDAKGSGGIWAESDRYLYWDATVTETGNYKMTFVFRDTINTEGNLTSRVGTSQRTYHHTDTTSNTITIPSVKLYKGDVMVDAWLREIPKWNTIRYPFYIEIEKLMDLPLTY